MIKFLCHDFPNVNHSFCDVSPDEESISLQDENIFHFNWFFVFFIWLLFLGKLYKTACVLFTVLLIVLIQINYVENEV